MARKIKKTKSKEERGIRQEMRHWGVLFEDMDHKWNIVAEQYGDIKKTLDSHTEMIGSLKTDSEIIKTDIEFIKNSLKRKIDVEEFSALEKRVILLEKKLSAR